MSGPAVPGVQRALGSELGRTGIVVQRQSCHRVWVEEWDLPRGKKKAELDLKKLHSGWDMSGTFGSDPPNAGVCGRFGEYRQSVKGRFTRNGHPVPKPLPDGRFLHPTTFFEDGDSNGRKYGYHDIEFSGSEFTDPDQGTGQRWTGQDDPGMTVVNDEGDTMSVDLTFRGEFIDTRRPTKPLKRSTWRVVGEATYPPSGAPRRRPRGDKGSAFSSPSR